MLVRHQWIKSSLIDLRTVAFNSSVLCGTWKWLVCRDPTLHSKHSRFSRHLCRHLFRQTSYFLTDLTISQCPSFIRSVWTCLILLRQSIYICPSHNIVFCLAVSNTTDALPINACEFFALREFLGIIFFWYPSICASEQQKGMQIMCHINITCLREVSLRHSQIYRKSKNEECWASWRRAPPLTSHDAMHPWCSRFYSQRMRYL